MKFAFIEQHASTWPVNVMCRMLGVSRSGYYDWRGRAPGARTTANLALIGDVRRLQERHQGRYGSPRMHAALRVEGWQCSRGRVERLMRRHRIRALAGRRFRPCTTDSRHYLPIAPNLLAQNFVATAPNRIWLADITYIATGEGWLYLAAVLDLATRKIIGWAMRDHMRTELPLAAMMMAAQHQRPAPGLICHSDRGSQYAAGAYVDYLSAIRAVPSMSRTANCYDNAPMERFFHTLKVELVHQCRWATRSEARQALFGYIEGYYNRHRMHSALGYLTPEQAEQWVTGHPSVSAEPRDDHGMSDVTTRTALPTPAAGWSVHPDPGKGISHLHLQAEVPRPLLSARRSVERQMLLRHRSDHVERRGLVAGVAGDAALDLPPVVEH